MRRVGVAVLLLLGVYLVGRAIVELFVIDVGDPSSYENDWGGPSLIGVLALHCLPGLVVAVLILRWLMRRRSARSSD